MNRRRFLGSLAMLTAGMALDPERALWVPGRKSYFDIDGAKALPSGYVFPPAFRRGDIIEIAGVFDQHPITGQEMPHLQQFVITDDASADDLKIQIWPPRLVATRVADAMPLTVSGSRPTLNTAPTRHV